MKRILSLSLAVCFMIASIFPVNTVQATSVTRNLEAEAVADVKLQETLNKYFELRNEMLLGESSIEFSRDKDSPKLNFISQSVYTTCRCATCGSKYDEAHTWTEFNSMYRCTKCLRTSNVIPVTPNDISNALLTQVQWNEMPNNSVSSIDDSTVLCHIGDQYYLVKGYSPDEALRFAREKINQADGFSTVPPEHS